MYKNILEKFFKENNIFVAAQQVADLNSKLLQTHMEQELDSLYKFLEGKTSITSDILSGEFDHYLKIKH